MSHVICVVEDRQKTIRFTWSDGTGNFDPYSLEGEPLTLFRQTVADCRSQLDAMAQDYLRRVESTTEAQRRERDQALRLSCLALAQAGYSLFERLFRPPGKARALGQKIREWLTHLRDRNEVEALELVLGDKKCGDPGVPWTVIYDEPPRENAFLLGDDSERWRPFWGVRYNLAAGKRVDPLRRGLAPENPTVRLVVDADVLTDLGEVDAKLLRAFAAKHDCGDFITTEAHLKECLSRGRPTVLYWLSHADPSALLLGGKEITPERLYEVLDDSMPDDTGQFPGLVFLNACQTGIPKAPGSSFLNAIYRTECSGLIATEHSTVDTFASPLGLEFLRGFLDRGESVGEALHALRLGKKIDRAKEVGGENKVDEIWVGGMPMGLVYATFCPPHIRKTMPAMPQQPAINEPQPQPGNELIRRVERSAQALPLPKHPYRSLSYYDRDDRALFAGRDGDVLRFARILDESATRVLVLHGESGCGKSSFLRAGVIPFLEDKCIGYRFVHEWTAGEKSSLMFVRATKDLPGQIADAMVRLCGKPWSQQSPEGQPVVIDLPPILGERRDVVTLRQALLDDRKLLGRLMSELGERLPFTPVLVIDQAEEVFTLARERGDELVRAAALQILRETAETLGRFKVVAALRTEYYGRFVDGLRRGVRPAYGVREYLLADFTEAQLTEAILKPRTFPRYDFDYADGVAQKLASDIVDNCRNSQDSVLPLAHVICTQLYDQLDRGPAGRPVIRQANVDAIGGLRGSMERHVERLLQQHLPRAVDRKAFQRLLTHLYHTQPDGALTTALMPVTRRAGELGSIEEHWRGEMPLDELLEVMTGPDVRLLRKNTLRLGGGEQRHFVSLGHDALAPVAHEWKGHFQLAARRRKWLIGLGAACLAMGAACLAALLMSVLYVRARIAETEAVKEKNRAELAERETFTRAYFAKMNLAQKAWEDADLVRLIGLLEDQKPKHSAERDIRGFEWYYWWGLSHPDLLTIDSGSESVVCVAFSPDGKKIASGASDGTVRISYAEKKEGEPPPLLKGHEGQVMSVAFSPDGKRIASGDGEGTVRISDARNGRTVRFWENSWKASEHGIVLSVAFSLDGKMIAGAMNGTVWVWDKEKSEKLLTLKGYADSLDCVAFSPDGKRIAGGTNGMLNGTLQVWDAEKGWESPVTLKGTVGLVSSVAFSPDGKKIASSARDGTVRVWDANKGEVLLTLKGPAGSSVAFSSDGKRIVGGDHYGVVRIWDAEKGGEALQTLLSRESDTIVAAFSPDRKRIASAQRGRVVRVWEPEKGVKAITLKTYDEHSTFDLTTDVTFSPDGKRIARRCRDGTVRVWGTEKGEASLSLVGPADAAQCVAFSPDGKRIAGGAHNGTVRIWDAEKSAEALSVLPPDKGFFDIRSVAFSPDGKRIAGVSYDGPITVWDAENRKVLKVLKGSFAGADVAFSPNGKRIASVNGEVTVWDTETWVPLQTLPAHVRVLRVAFSPDGKKVVSCGDLGDGSVEVWDVEKGGEALLTLKGFAGYCRAVTFSPDSKRFACGDENAVRVFDAGLGAETVTFSGLTVPVDSLSWCQEPNGERVAAVLADGTLRVWYAPKVP
jgi:WD40 repeat protein